jgi:hypothetical protein
MITRSYPYDSRTVKLTSLLQPGRMKPQGFAHVQTNQAELWLSAANN